MGKSLGGRRNVTLHGLVTSDGGVTVELRHGHAVQFVKNGGDIRNPQKLLGHANIYQTQEYLRVAEDVLREAARKFGPEQGNDETDD